LSGKKIIRLEKKRGEDEEEIATDTGGGRGNQGMSTGECKKNLHRRKKSKIKTGSRG